MNSNQLLNLVRLLAPKIQDFLGGSDVAYFKDRIKDTSSLSIPRNGGVIDQGSDVLLCFKNRVEEVSMAKINDPVAANKIDPVNTKKYQELSVFLTSGS